MGQAAGRHRLVERLYLGLQLIGHGRTMRLVLLEQLVAEGLALGVEDHGDVIGIDIGHQLAQHVEHPVHGAGRLTAAVGQGRQGIERAVKIGGPIHQH